MQFGPPPSNPVNVQTVAVTVGATPAQPKAKAEKGPCDLKLASAAHELRDRYLEQANAPAAGMHFQPAAQRRRPAAA